MSPSGSLIDVWVELADALLLQAAAARDDASVDRLAGLRIRDEDAQRLAAELADPAVDVEPPDDAALAEIGARFTVSLQEEADAFAVLVRRAELDGLEAQILAVLCAVELDPRRQRLVAYLQDDVSRPRPTLHLLHRIFGDLGMAQLSDDGALRRAALIDVEGDVPFASRQVVLAPLVLWSLLGAAELDPHAPPGAHVLDGGRGEPAISFGSVVTVAGPDRARRLQAAIAALGGGPVIVTPATPHVAQLEALVRSATVAGAGVVVELEADPDDALRRTIERATHLRFALCSPSAIAVSALPERPWVDLAPEPPLVTQVEAKAVLGERGSELAERQRFTADQLLAVDRVLPAVGGDSDAAVRRLAAGRLERLARRVPPRRQWTDLILVPEQERHLRELVDRYRVRHVVHDDWGVPAVPSAGVVAMFSGSSGTGKTTAAEIVAGELGLDLFVVELSAVVSKYIGETEKNLEQIFDVAATANMVLLFDEADALFGTRSEITDARDRYANMEVSYLLQRVETYDGIVVLTTNYSRNIDAAFLRRIHFAIEFPEPGVPERLAIWHHHLGDVPLADDVDLEFLAERIKVAGGSIRNACVTAAFLAASDDGAVAMRHLVWALKRELEKLGRLSTKQDFGPWYSVVAADS